METRSAAIHRKMPTSTRQLPITGFAHKAGVVGDLGMAALLVLATRDMAAEGRRAAVLDRRHHLQLAKAHTAGVGLSPCRSIAAEYIRDLQCRAGHLCGALSGRLLFGRAQRGEPVEWAHDLADGVGRDAGIERGGIELGVTERARVIMHLLLTH